MHKSLSKKSLALVYQWAESHAGNALAEAYNGACIGVGMMQTTAVIDVVAPYQRKKYYGYIYRAFDSYRMGIDYRDSIGRMILDLLKRQEKRSADTK